MGDFIHNLYFSIRVCISCQYYNYVKIYYYFMVLIILVMKTEQTEIFCCLEVSFFRKSQQVLLVSKLIHF